MAEPRVIALLSDFGLQDGYVGVMKGVILGIAPGVQLVDISHDVPPQDVLSGAWILSTAWRSFPQGTIFLAVVDPGVGTVRRSIALTASGFTFVGPDNGLFSHVLDSAPAETAVILDRPAFYATPSPSATFHGRDIFAPCAAHLASGIALSTLGTALDPRALVRLLDWRPTWEGDTLLARVLHIDRFGNLITSIGPPLVDLVLREPRVTVSVGEQTLSARFETFGEAPERVPFLLRDSSGHLAIAVRNGSAAAALRVGRGGPMRVVGLTARPGRESDADKGGGPA